MIKLIGILVVAVGFALRFNTLLVVLVAGIVTGLVAGMSFQEILEALGKYFVDNRTMTLPVVLMVPLIGLLERHGLQVQAEDVIRRTKAATAGKVILYSTLLRQVMIALGVKIGGHAEAVRPLVAPMAEAAARRTVGALRAEAAARRTVGALRAEAAARQSVGALPAEAAARQAIAAEGGAVVLPEELSASIRAHAAAGENVGNFFGEDVFIAVGAILLMKGFFDALKMDVSVWAMALWGLPTALVASAVMAWRTRVLDRRIAASAADIKPEAGP